MRVLVEKLIQSELKRQGHYTGKIDGDRGPKTDLALEASLTSQASALPDGWQEWSSKRKAIAVLQLAATSEGIDAGDIDGWWGPQTEFAFDALYAKRNDGQLPRSFRDLDPLDINPNSWPKQSDVSAFFGPHGVKGGVRPPLKKVSCPWKLKLAWNLNQSVSGISIHEKCADSLERVLADIRSSYSDQEIADLRLDHYGGSYNPRKMRNGSKWSMHSWGIAIDWDPAHNKLKDNHTKASMAAAEFDPWWSAWEKEGWLSLGRERNFDWMHVQASKL